MYPTPTTPRPLVSMMRQPPGDVPGLTPEALMTPQQAAQVLGLSVKTLATWRSTGRHALPFIRCGGRVRYRRSDVNAWLESQSRISTATAMKGAA